MKTTITSAIVLAGVFLCSCAQHPVPPDEDFQDQLQSQFTETPDITQKQSPYRWWQTFESQELDSLVKRALDNNWDIQTARNRLQQAQLLVDIVKAQHGPSLNLSGSIEERKTKSYNKLLRESDIENTETLGLRAVGQYEVDLWGRLAAETRSKEHAVKAARKDVATAAITTSAEIARAWISLIVIDRKLDLIDRQEKLQRKYLESLTTLLEHGEVAKVDVTRQKQTLQSVQSRRPPLQEKRATQRHRLAALLGANRTSVSVEASQLPDLPVVPSPGTPYRLLSARPDICAAFARWKAAWMEKESTRLDQYPTLKINASALFSSPRLDKIFRTWVLSLTGELTQSIIDSGLREARTERANIQAKGQWLKLRDTVQQATKEVEDALAQEKARKQLLEDQKAQLQTARETLKGVQTRYRNGASDYLSVLDANRTVLELERQLWNTRQSVYLARISLHRALGGYWTKNYIQNPASSTTSKKPEQ